MQDYEWDEDKRRANLAKHGIDLAHFGALDWDRALFFPDDYIDGEQRCRALAFLGDRLVYAVFTIRGDRCRVISMRKATRGEYRVYGDG